MALTKKTILEKCETVSINKGSHYCLQVKERNQILEDGDEISASYDRYVLQPDHDISTITDNLILSQFNAVMTDEVKANYAKFLKEQAEQNKAS
ncbi:hypothetical protein [uncultured Mediterranean phage uvMED]|nr:hypothetical protein [uncultured Mediterranean phage uvMED]